MNIDKGYAPNGVTPEIPLTSYHGASRGTVAARINAFQDRSTNQHPSSHARPRILSSTFEPDVVIGHGRRTESSFASPAGRSPRDGTESARGDGRAPVGSSDLVFKSSPLRPISALIHPSPSRIFIPNSSLTLDGKYDDPFTGPSNEPAPPKKPESELAGARARLRPVREKKGPNNGKAPENSTIEELGYMLDSAIIEQSSDASPVKIDVPSPQSPLSRSRSTRAPQRITDLGPRCVERLATMYRLSSRPGTSSSRNTASSPLEAPPPFGTPRSPPRFSQQQQQQQNKSRAYSSASVGIPDRCASPVKQRAALFESLYYSPLAASQLADPPPRAHLHNKEELVTIPGHFPIAEVEARLHRLKLGQSVDLHSSTAEAQSSSRDTEAYETARESTLSPIKRTPSKNAHHRAPSRGWPAHTPGSGKTGVSHPQQIAESVSQHIRDAHHPPTRPSIVSQRIAQLALAGLESEQISSRPHSVANSRSRHTSATSATVTESEIREHALDGGRFKPSQLPPLQIHTQEEEADNLHSKPHEDKEPTRGQIRARSLHRNRETAQTPASLSMYEKQVAQPSQHGLVNEGAGGPSTPVRGRAAARRTPRSPGYGVEQSFYFSPIEAEANRKQAVGG